MTTIVLASSNPKKLQELQQILHGKYLEFVPQSRFNIPDATEDGLSFVENAILKARQACWLSGMPAIADDSGLEVDALGGEPGIYSARFAAREGTGKGGDADNNALLLSKLAHLPEAQRTARFQCVVVLMRRPDDPMPLVCQGTWEGRILEHESGANGFGYDPLFYVPQYQCSAAELSPAVKNALSHRGQALRELLARWPLATGVPPQS